MRDLGLEKVEETVLIRTRVHNRRGTGGYAWICVDIDQLIANSTANELSLMNYCIIAGNMGKH